MLIQVRMIPEDDYVLGAANDFLPSMEDVVAATSRSSDPADARYMSRLDMAHRVARDNTHQEGALRAAQMLLAVPEQVPYADEVQAEGRSIWRRRFWR